MSWNTTKPATKFAWSSISRRGATARAANTRRSRQKQRRLAEPEGVAVSSGEPAPRPARRTLAAVFSLLLSFFAAGCSASPRVVLYCAHDREFSEKIIEDFRKQTHIDVLAKFDTEANKSVGLFQDLVREAPSPRCDVHWNNEILATIRLQKLGILQPYASPSGDAYPEEFRATDRSWHAFGARARVLLVNTDLVPKGQWPTSLRDLTEARFRGKVAMAKPQFGTTATHAACLFAAWGEAKAKKFFRDLKANNVRLVPGNKQAAEGVGQGQFAVGLTDTDDAMAEVRQGRPVQIIFPDQGEGGLGTLFLPNTVALIRNCPNPENGKKLIDFLLSAEVEKKLALSESCQIPLNPNVQAELPPPMRPALAARKMQVDFYRAADLWEPTQRFLTEEFAR